ncbi:MAG: ABC transporter ATP-binding protein, partial [SAR202 cluster bacterium]|nr:ABC transporter ATP-binding protein [SAR202 cluster bacterium]
QKLSFSYHSHIHTGDLITRGILDIEGVSMFVRTAVLRSIYLVVLIGTGTYLVLSADLVLGIISLSFVPFAGWRATAARLQLRSSWFALQEKLSILSKVMDENLGGIRVVRSFASKTHEMDKFDRASEEALTIANNQVQIKSKNVSLIGISFLTAMGLVLWVGGLKVINGSITIGELTTFLAFMSILQAPVRMLGMMVNAFARGAASGGRLFSVLDMSSDIEDSQGSTKLTITKGVLKFKEVHFGYEGEHTLNGVTFEVKPGHVVGIVGPPGSGKSTIAHLIPRFYDPSSGAITIDGQNIKDVTLDSLRHAVSVVEQDSFMFTASIDHNVAYGNPWAEDLDVETAARNTQMYQYISRLPNKFSTMIGERGVSLSGGQRQRLSIARSILLNPKIIIFDDSTSSVDAATEQKIRVALQEISRDRTSIIISHRLSSLMHADEILFIEKGKIIERGNHNKLINNNGKYAELYKLQIRPDDKNKSEKIKNER